jgi:hypothetical protein
MKRVHQRIDRFARHPGQLIREVIAWDRAAADRVRQLEHHTAGWLQELEGRHEHLLRVRQRLRSL